MRVIRWSRIRRVWLASLIATAVVLATGCVTGGQTPPPSPSPPLPSVLETATSQEVAADALGSAPVQSRVSATNIPVDGTPEWTVDFGEQVPTARQLASLVLHMARLMPAERVVVVTGVWQVPRASTDTTEPGRSKLRPHASATGSRQPRLPNRVGATVYWNRSDDWIANPLGDPGLAAHSVAVGQGTHAAVFAPPGVGLADSGEVAEDWLFVKDVTTPTVEAWASGRVGVDLAIDPNWPFGEQ